MENSSKASEKAINSLKDVHISAKTSEETLVEMCQVIEGCHVNQYSRLSCGQLLKWVDITACLSAERLSGCPCVTVSVDDLYFKQDVKLGDVVSIKAKIHRAFKTSMEVGVQVFAERINHHENGVPMNICEAYLTFVAMDQTGNKIILPTFSCSSEVDEIEYSLAEERKKIRISHSKTILHLLKSYTSQQKVTLSHSQGCKDLKEVNVRNTRVESVELVLPSYANHHGNTFGGQIMAWVENIGFVSALRFCRVEPTLRSVDMVHFRAPSYVGDRIVLKATINNAFHKSLEVGVRVEAYDCKNGKIGKRRHINSAFLSYDVGSDVHLPILITDSEESSRRSREATARKKIRLDKRYILSNKRQEKLSVVLNDDNAMYISYSNIEYLSKLSSTYTEGWNTVADAYNLTLSTKDQNGILICKVSVTLSDPNISLDHCYTILSSPQHRVNWDPLMLSSELIHPISTTDNVYYNVMKTSINDEDDNQNNAFLLLTSCRKPSRKYDPYLIAMRSVLMENAEIPSNDDANMCEIACAGFVIEKSENHDIVVSYYNETNPQLVAYVTSDVAGCSRFYSKIFNSMISYLSKTLPVSG